MDAARIVWLTGALVLAVSGCTWIKPDPGSDVVHVATPDMVTGCKKLATVNTSVKASIGNVQRDPGKVRRELATLARNGALEIGADTVVPDGPITNGRRAFLAYRCG